MVRLRALFPGAAALASFACGGGDEGGRLPGEPIAPVALSTSGAAAFVPSLAAHGDRVLIAWHEFGGGGTSHVRAVVVGEAPGPSFRLEDEGVAVSQRPSVAATGDGWLVAWQAVIGSAQALRLAWLDGEGELTAGPETLAGTSGGAMARVVSNGERHAVAWTDGAQHFFAMLGEETTAAAPIAPPVSYGGILSFARLALRPDGELVAAWRDGGPDSNDLDVRIATRPPGGSFGAPTTPWPTPELLSDDLSLAVRANGTVDLAWVEQSPDAVEHFDAVHATLSPAGETSDAAIYAGQNDLAWLPAVAPGGLAVWHTGTSGAFGEMWIALPGDAPEPLFPERRGGTLALAVDESGRRHLAFTDDATPRAVWYARLHP